MVHLTIATGDGTLKKLALFNLISFVPKFTCFLSHAQVLIARQLLNVWLIAYLKITPFCLYPPIFWNFFWKLTYEVETCLCKVIVCSFWCISTFVTVFPRPLISLSSCYIVLNHSWKPMFYCACNLSFKTQTACSPWGGGPCLHGFNNKVLRRRRCETTWTSSVGLERRCATIRTKVLHNKSRCRWRLRVSFSSLEAPPRCVGIFLGLGW